MAELKRTYNVPLRKEFIKAPRYNKTKKAVKALKEFLAKHMKVKIENVRIGNNLNKKLWSAGIRHPPHHVKIDVIKDDNGFAFAELEGVEYARKKEEKEDKSKLTQMMEKVTGKKSVEKKVEPVDAEFKDKPTEQKESKKPVEKKSKEVKPEGSKAIKPKGDNAAKKVEPKSA